MGQHFWSCWSPSLFLLHFLETKKSCPGIEMLARAKTDFPSHIMKENQAITVYRPMGDEGGMSTKSVSGF